MKHRKVKYKSNLDNATPEQMEAFYENLSDAINTLYRSVAKRKMQELMKVLY